MPFHDKTGTEIQSKCLETFTAISQSMWNVLISLGLYISFYFVFYKIMYLATLSGCDELEIKKIGPSSQF